MTTLPSGSSLVSVPWECKSDSRFKKLIEMWRRAHVFFILVGAALLGRALLGYSSGFAQAPEPSAAERNLAIVVNLSNPVDDLAMADLRRVFLGERGHWPNGRRITLVMLERGWPEREAVLNSIYHMDETEFNRHFLHGLFTGEVFVSPKTLSTPEGVRKFINFVPGAIGYLRASDVDKTVKVIRIDERLPGDKGYKLHVPPREGK